MTTVLELGDILLTRMLYADAVIDPAAVGLTPAEVRAVSWGSPEWAQDGQVRAADVAPVTGSAWRTV